MITASIIKKDTAKKAKAGPLHVMEAFGAEEFLLILDLGTRWG
jgi:hypothetical protein